MTTEIEICKVLECLAPWIEKTNGEESIGSWETTMATKMTFKSAVANQHYKTICKMMKDDMPELMFANHIKYMVHKYGKKKAVMAENSNGSETNNK